MTAQRPPGPAGVRLGRPWWHYVTGVFIVLALAGMVWGGYAIWFSLTHVRASYARITGLQVNVAAKEDTRVEEVLPSTGDTVRAGQVVVLLDKADMEARSRDAQQSALARAERELELTIRETAASVEQAEARLAAARARLAQSEAQFAMESEQQPDEVRQARADLASARSRLNNAGARHRRLQKLREEGAVSEQAVDAARTDYEVAEAAVAAAEGALAVAEAKDHEGQIRQHEVATRTAEQQQATAEVKSAQTQEARVALREEEVVERQAAVAQAEATIEEARVRLADCSLRSPVNGVVVKGIGRSVKDGEVVVKGMPIVAVVSTDQPLWITLAVSELYVDRVRAGQPVVIRIDAFGRRRFHGAVEKVGRATESSLNQTSPWTLQQVPVKLTFDPEGADVRHGMTCRVWIDARKR
jgi:membrane fusion protein (multidrug efflux system)